MIEISMTEALLLLWAVGATATALHYKEQVGTAKHFIQAIIANEDLRNRMVEEYKKFKKEAA